METVVIVIHLMVVLALVLVVLLQRSEGGALGIGGGGGGLVSSRGTANILTRATAVLAAVFFVTSMALSLIAKNQDSPASILDATPAATTGAPVTTDGGSGTDGAGGILDSLKQQSQPSGPQVPAAQ
ncbi:preprotein translocase subunit SecG [Labrenzia sp. OB1]|uniref:preprotein translocase subunit SecG n=1 Tax=Labrenzia sp. OB1 TaxID=1561204 RepID=UPI0007B2703D|nr:preprotein translocase subunit SecG [Labrenzia sp. OB1]KZM48063.1 preprotein translocase subunit SecG [Labrenzia sp. OB1]